MAILPEDETFDAAVDGIGGSGDDREQLIGGIAGALNRAARALVNRTRYLYERLKGRGVNVDDYKALVAGSDWTAAVQAAMSAAAGKRLLFPPRDYLLSAEIAGVSNVDIVAWGARFYATTKVRSLIAFDAKSNFRIRGAKFDLGQPVLPTFTEAEMPAPANAGVYCVSSADGTIERCEFVNLYTSALFFYGCSGTFHLPRNHFASPVQAQGARAEHILVQTCSADFYVTRSRFINARPTSAGYGVPAFFASGTTGLIVWDNNRAKYCGRDASITGHQLGAFSCYGDNRNVQVTDSAFDDVLERGVRLTCTHDAEVRGCRIGFSDLCGDHHAAVSIEGTAAFLPTGVGGVKNISVHHNRVIEEHSTTRVFVSIGAADYAVPSTNISVHDNDVDGAKWALVLAGPFKGVKFNFNTLRGSLGNTIGVQQSPGLLEELHGVLEAAGVYDGLEVRGNMMECGPSDASAVNVDLQKTPAFTGSVGDFDFDDNTFKRTSAAAATAIVIRGVNTKGRYTVSRNRFKNWANVIDAANAAEVVLTGNRGQSISGAGVIDSGNLGVLERSGNHWNTGARSGRVALVAGTATINTTEVLSADNIVLSRVVAGGTLGHLSVGTITPGTSFVLNSSSGADTSTIFWRVDH